MIRRLVPAEPTVAQARGRLSALLAGQWKPIWRKAVNKKPRPHPTKPRPRGHCSVHQVLEAKKHQSTGKNFVNRS